MDKQSIQQLSELLQGKKKIFVVSHKNPDGDAIGSAIGWGRFLKNMGHEVVVSTPNEYPDFIAWIEGAKDIVMYSQQPEKVKEEVENADLIFCLDFNALQRIDETGDFIAKAKGKKILIDHHQQPSDVAEVLFSDTTFTSTCEMVYHFTHQMSWMDYMDIASMECIYAGMVTDTASFRFPVVTSETHRIVADMMDKGLEHAKIHQSIYDTQSENRIRLVGYALSAKLEVWKDRGVAIVYLSNEELERFHHQSGDTEGLVNQALSIDGVHLAAFFKEAPEEGKVKCSFRSQGDFDVNTFARKYWNGGGHFNAAGGHWPGSLSEAMERFKELTKP